MSRLHEHVLNSPLAVFIRSSRNNTADDNYGGRLPDGILPESGRGKIILPGAGFSSC